MTVDKVKVAVRVRPFNRREIELKTQSVIEMDANSTVLRTPQGSSNSPPSSDQPSDQASRKSAKSFSFDHCFDSMNKNTGATQEQVFDALGDYILDDAFKGYNACIFAYGQTGSGKSYTMMGSQDDPGLIPRLSVELFERIIKSNDQANETKAEVSYMEIYNEKVHDLLDPLSGKKGGLRVREHSVLGPYVDGLSQLVVSNYKDIEVLMEEGNKSRTVAATNMNNESSRSHAVFTIILTSRLTDLASGVTGERVSRISLVDLAGSERALKTGAVGQRLKEGSNINKSLTTLGLVISKLAETNQGNKNKDKFIPYRDSALTWLLKDSLGGNSRTVMIATISPAGDNYQETLSTLRYADRAKRIVNNAVVNEDPNAKVIRELRSEIEALKEMLIHSADPRLLKEKLGENEKLMKEVSLTWQEKMDKTEQIQEDRRQAMEKMGISIQSSGIKVEKDRYFLVNLNSDPSMNELLVYYLNPDVTLVGREDASITQNIQLSGLGISSEHCKISVEEGIPYIESFTDAKTCINGREIQSKSILRDGDRILWGCNHLFRLNCPKLRGQVLEDSAIVDNSVEDGVGNPGVHENGGKIESADQGGSVDWMMAQEEVLMRGTGNHVDIVKRFESEKEAALEEQRKDYENKIENLKQALAMQQDFELRGGENGSPALMSSSFIEDENEDDLQQTENWAMGLSKLREDIVLANMLIREANLLAAELGKSTTFSSTLRIPPQNLTPNRYHGGFLAEPAILVRQGESGQMATWSLQKMDSKIILMRDMYKRKISGMTRSDDDISSEEDYIDEGVEDPFHEVAQNHDLIGVANLYLDSLFHKVHYEYCIPLISAQGEVSGRLKVELEKVEGSLPEDRFGGADDSSSEELSHLSGDSGHSSTTTDLRLQGSNSTTPPNHVIMRGEHHNNHHQDNSIKFRMKISELRGIAPVFSDFVFCEFSIDGGESHLVLPKMTTQVSREGSGSSSIPKSTMSGTVQFQYENMFTVPITEEFVDLCTDGAVAIHVYSKRMDSYTQDGSGSLDRTVTTLEDTWDMVTRRIQLDMQILELNDQGEYTPVEIQGEEGEAANKGGKTNHHTGKELLRGGTGGTFQIRQGQQKRLKFKVAVLQNTGSGSLPLDIAGVSSIAVGAEVLRSGSNKAAAGCPSAVSLPLDSYQEDDLNYLREAWSQALHQRKLHLQTQIQAFMDLENKSDEEKSREDSLIDQLVQLMEEQNATYSPPDNTSIPGSMISGSVEAGLEKYHPVLYFNSEQIRNQIKVQDEMYVPLVGEDSIISKELGSEFIELPLVNQCIEAGICEAAWDTSLHTSDFLNKVTEASQRVYMIARMTVRLAQPFTMDIVLRKRFSVTVMPNRQSLTNRIWKKLATSSNIVSVGVIYQLVDRLPTTSAELENRESLATVAASGREILAQDGESLIEKYSKGISSVNEILRTDRISQQIVLKELLTKQRKMFGQMPSRASSIMLGGGGGMRKTISVPNMKYFRTSLSNDNLSSGQHPLAGASTMMRMSDSFHEGCTINPSNNLLSNSNSNNQLSFGGNRKMRQSLATDEQQRGIPVRRMTSSKTMTTLHEESLGHHTIAENDNTGLVGDEQVIQKCDTNKHLEDNEKSGREETSASQLESSNSSSLEPQTIQQ